MCECVGGSGPGRRPRRHGRGVDARWTRPCLTFGCAYFSSISRYISVNTINVRLTKCVCIGKSSRVASGPRPSHVHAGADTQTLSSETIDPFKRRRLRHTLDGNRLDFCVFVYGAYMWMLGSASLSSRRDGMKSFGATRPLGNRWACLPPGWYMYICVAVGLR